MPHRQHDAASFDHSTARPIILGGIAALASLAVQIIVPAVPLMTRSIGATTREPQLILSVYSVGLAPGQLIWGPLADTHGRWPVLMLGLMIFLAGTACCASARDLLILLIGRAAQSTGASAALAAERVMGRIARRSAVRQRRWRC